MFKRYAVILASMILIAIIGGAYPRMGAAQVTAQDCTAQQAQPPHPSPRCLAAGVQEASAQLNPKDIKPLFGQAASPNLSAPDYSYRADWGYKNGQWLLTLYSSSIHASSKVFASISEVDQNNVPFVGPARYTVYNVAPREGAVVIWINIEWSSTIHTQASYLIINT